MLVIKKDAVITAKIGVGFISELQKTFLHLSDRKKEDIDKLQTLVAKKEPLTEPWMNDVMLIGSLLNQLELLAKEQGFVEDIEEKI
jgi:hypothetical protein